MRKLWMLVFVMLALGTWGCDLGSDSHDHPAAEAQILTADAGPNRTILAGLDLTLKASGDPGHAYTWDFGDGTKADGQIVTHEYNGLGAYTVRLVVRDTQGNQATDVAQVSVITWDSLATPLSADGHAIEAPLVDFLPDGRMVAAEGNSATEIEIAVETAAGSKQFAYVTSIVPPTASSFGSFLKVFDAQTLIVGVSTHIYKVMLSPARMDLLVAAGNFEAVISGSLLYFTRSVYNPDWSAQSFVSRIDLGNPGTPTDCITGIPGASAGVCLDEAGNIYTGNGYTNFGLPDENGLIKRFAASALPLPWSTGAAVGDLLSAGTLIWAGNGTILVGGGDAFGSGDAGYFAALDTASGDKRWKLDPDPADGSFYKLSANSGRFAASVWVYPLDSDSKGHGTIFLLPYAALGL